MPKDKPEKAANAGKRAGEKALPATSRDELVAEEQKVRDATKRVRQAERDLARSRAEQVEKRRQYEIQRARDANVQARRDAENQTVPVIVQTRHERPVRVREGIILSRVPVKVSRRTLRRLEGLRRKGSIQLIVGELEKPGEVMPPDFLKRRLASAADQAAEIKAAKAKAAEKG